MLDDPAFPVPVVGAYEPDGALDESDVDSYITRPVSKPEFVDAVDRAL